ncbi:MAG: nucleoside triphosphate pyrophosphohydrolase [Deltaproteobacteria bacterium]|jgi:tetrapyrrole methylase family protein / MazG family protein|nr:nucleoside triphosphate pyrophosphohydrolase [Deltaproteobacteria bacterium]MBT4525784.1 nucleoside triphosphate pyrophosphohydrolase [Deltaproteobacteria bacterium]
MQKLVNIVDQLRSPDGCPWDRKQTHQTLIPYLLEEAWEVIDEIKSKNFGETLKDELGDVLLQVLLHAQIAKEEGRFTIDDVVDGICKKMIDRHPHVFEEKSEKISADAQKKVWHQRKVKEKKMDSVLDGISTETPALISALKIGQRVSSVGFDWENPWQVFEKIEEEMSEVKKEMEKNDNEKIEEEIGDLLFTISNLARFYKINPEVALKRGNDKFKKRFVTVEKQINQSIKSGKKLSMAEMEETWEKSKVNSI